VALLRPLRLKSETIRPKAEQSSSLLPIARCWVDSGVFHLDQSFDYLVPDNLDSRVSIGTRVEVPFHGREVEAIVLSRHRTSDLPALKPITKVISTQSVATKQTINLIEAASRRWACHPFDVIRSAIPPRVASIEKKPWIEPLIGKSKADHKKIYLQIPAHIDRYRFISDSVKSRSTKGSMLIVVPDTRSISHLHQFFPEAIVLDSALGRSERYENFLKCRYGRNPVVIGPRSAIFAPIGDLQTIVVVDEGSESHYEIRSPGWNVRDLALLRASIEGIALAFIGYSPSAEIARLIDIGQISYIARKNRIDVRAYSQSNGELLPSRLIKDIRTSAHQGPILFLALRKGYSQSIACAQCKNIAHCACGGKLQRLSERSAPECSICSKRYQDWTCSWCHSSTPFLMGRVSERFEY
jgi:primosomal protein N' (replication factor Y)